jgi:hypothetical protein
MVARSRAVPPRSAGHGLAISLARPSACETGTMTASTRIRGQAGPVGAAKPASIPSRHSAFATSHSSGG